MKLIKTISFIMLAVLSLLNTNLFAKNSFENGDSINVMVEASLFFEAYKIKQYEMWTIEKGLNVIKAKPDFMPQYKIYKKIDKVIFEVYADSSISEDTRKVLSDTAIYLYNIASNYDKEDAGYYLLKKAYVLDQWKHSDPEISIAAYEKGFSLDTVFTSDEIYYADQLGNLYVANMNENNEYKMKALDIYMKLADLEPENPLWTKKMAGLAEDQTQLQDILKKAWYLDKENTEKAWRYATICKKNGDYTASLEPLQFLIDKNPEVINYWNEIARAYQKNDQVDKAISSYKKLIDLQPENRDSYLNLALIYKDMDQLAVSRSYLQKASKVSPGWDYPIYIEAGLYEQAARSCGFEFEDKCVYQLAADTYRQVSRMGGEHASSAAERVSALSNSVPSKEDYFFRKKQNGDVIKIEGKCYDWIGKSITVSF
ncbi:MAG: tetratricopeptide repeat protein [Ignavibacteriales bacterium]|nr:tetratricopeptide repeat protein [Ignavibacteriales bacterium]